jgi:hypothetical protein
VVLALLAIPLVVLSLFFFAAMVLLAVARLYCGTRRGRMRCPTTRVTKAHVTP